MIVMNTGRVVKHNVSICLFLLPMVGAILGCTGKGRRNDLRPLSDGSFDEEYQQHIVITDDSIKPFEVESEEACLHVELPQEMLSTRLDTVFSSYSFVRLETSEKCLVGHIDRIIKCPGCYCILDRDNSNVFIFEEDGKFRCKLGSKGHARNEHLDAWNIAYDEKNNYIVLLDLAGRRLQSYDLNGNLKKVAPLYFLYKDMAFLGDDMLCMTGSSYNASSDIVDLSQLILADRTQKPRRVGFPTSKERRNRFCWGTMMQQYEDKAYFNDLVSDTIWEIYGERMSPLVVTTANGVKTFSKDEKENMTDELYEKRRERVPHVSSFCATSQFVAVSVALPREGNMLVLMLTSRKSGMSKVVGLPVFSDRLECYLPMVSIDGFSDDSTLIYTLQPTNVLQAINNIKAKRKLNREEQILSQNLQPDDNPVLMLSRLVDF